MMNVAQVDSVCLTPDCKPPFELTPLVNDDFATTLLNVFGTRTA